MPSRFLTDDDAPTETFLTEDDEDELPTPPRRASLRSSDDEDPPVRRVARRGWGAAEKVKNTESSFAQRLKLGEDPVIIKFLEDEPYAAYRQHWVERNGQKSFFCIGDEDPRGCPLCDAGNRSSARFSFNVALLEKGTEPLLKSYDVGIRVIDQLKNFNNDPRQGPLSKHYWALTRTGKGTTSSTAHQVVKERDLEEEWDLAPLTEVDLSSFTLYTDEILQRNSRKDLMSIVAEDLGED